MVTIEAVPELKPGELVRLEADSTIAGTARLAPGSAVPRVLDWCERILVVGLYVWLAARLLIRYWSGGGVANLLLLPSEGLVVFFMLIRRPTSDVSRNPRDWILAFAATCAPMLVIPGVGQSLVSPIVGATVLLMGLVIQVLAKLTLGRSMGCVPAHRGLKLAGPYRFVRHPMYAGYLLSHLAFLAMNPIPWNLIAYVVCYSLQIPRLLAEERLLSQDERYREYKDAVRHRLIPGVF